VLLAVATVRKQCVQIESTVPSAFSRWTKYVLMGIVIAPKKRSIGAPERALMGDIFQITNRAVCSIPDILLGKFPSIRAIE
jgi:hypothetical protein